jgi:hypothetical protein
MTTPEDAKLQDGSLCRKASRRLQVELAEQTEALTDVAGTVKNVQAQSTFKV